MAISKVVYKESVSASPVTWIDATPSTAGASNIISPYTAMLANGVVTTGTGSSSGGASNFVTGTFTPSSSAKGTAVDISIPYTGSGYPLTLLIFPTVGSYKSGSDIYNSVQRYAILEFCGVKNDMSTAPDYYDSSDPKNDGYAFGVYKYSTSDPTSYSSGMSKNAMMYVERWSAGEGYSSCARFKSATTLSVFIANTSYGFQDGIEYTYQIVYSS